MIVQPLDAGDEAEKLAVDSAPVNRAPDILDDDAPPLYSKSSPEDEDDAETVVPQVPSRSRLSPPKINHSNFVHISQSTSSIKGSWILDPSLRIPTPFLPPLPPGEPDAERRNFVLESQNGSVKAEIFIAPTQIADQKSPDQRVTINTFSYFGSVTTMFHDIVATEPSKSRAPLLVSTSSTHGRISVYLPRSFHGMLDVESKYGSIRYSSELKARLRPLSNVDRAQRSFIGDFDPAKFEGDAEWVGDELTVRSKHGSVRVYFDDEVAPASPGILASLWTRLFGW